MERNGVRIGQWSHQFDEPAQGDTSPLCYSGPSLDAVVHRNVLFGSQSPQLIEGQFDRILDEARDLQPVISEVAFGELLPVFTRRHLAVRPEIRRNLIFR